MTITNGNVSWGNNITVNRSSIQHAVRVTGGRNAIGFQIYVPKGTIECVILANVGNAISTVSVTETEITISTASSGYGSTINYMAEVY